MYVRRLRIENIKGFREAEFDFRQDDKNGLAGWTVLVGGNASGKSTVLKLIALAIMGSRQGFAALRHPGGWMRHGSGLGVASVDLVVDVDNDVYRDATPTETRLSSLSLSVGWFRFDGVVPSFVDVQIHRRPDGDDQKLVMDFGADPPAPRDPNARGWFCCGYGPWRRLSGSSPDAARDSVAPGALRRHLTLFREDASLTEAEEWLRKHQFQMLEQGPDSPASRFLEQVKTLLSDGLLPAGFVIEDITSEQVFVKREGLRITLDDMSDGCRSVIALVLDLLRHLKDCFGPDLFDPDSATPIINRPGVVLIDEIEAHLHPTWQRELPVWLTKHFPRLQFIVTTHSPLIAQNADIDGLFVLPMPDEMPNVPRKLSREEVEQIRMGKAESTLLGAAFGLGTTRSIPAVERIERYQFLDAKRRAVALSEVEATDYAELKSMIGHQFDFEDSKAQG